MPISEINVYSKKGCIQCIQAKSWLKQEHKDKLNELKIEGDQERVHKVREHGGMLPLIELIDEEGNTNHFSGFNEEIKSEIENELT